MKKILLLIAVNFLFGINSYAQRNENTPIELAKIYERLDRFEQSKNISLINDDLNTSMGSLDNFDRKLEPLKWEEDLIQRISLSLRLVNKIENYLDFNFEDKYQYQITPPSCYETTRIKEPFVNGVSVRVSRYPKSDLSDFGSENCKQEYLRMLRENEQYKISHDYQIAVNQLLFRVLSELIDYFEHSHYTNIGEIDKFVTPLLDSHLDSESKIQEFKKRFEIVVQMAKEQEMQNPKH
jgi:hypothetical protein